MLKHATCLTLALIALLQPSSIAASRHPRSLWPWSQSQPKEEPLISEKHAQILRQSGYDEYLDLSKHPLWKIHKYEGIDLKPVQLETEIRKPKGEQQKSAQLPQLEQNPVSNVAPLTESELESESNSSSSIDVPELGFFDKLSVLPYLLPDFGFGSDDEQQTDALADAIRNEEQSQPGFFSNLWSKIWGSDESQSPDNVIEATSSSNEDEEDNALLQIALPATRQRYAEISLIQPSTQATRLIIREPANQSKQQTFNTGAIVSSQQPVVVQPINKWYRAPSQLHHSQAYVASWNPNAAYNVHVSGASEYPSEHIATVQAYTANHFKRKISENDEGVNVTDSINDHSRRQILEDKQTIPTTTSTITTTAAAAETATTTSQNSVRVSKSQKEEEDKKSDEVTAMVERQVHQVTDDLESKAREQQTKWRNVKDSITKFLSMNVAPARIANKLKGILRRINDKKAGEESVDELKKLVAEFESHKQQLGSFYPVMRRMIPALPETR